MKDSDKRQPAEASSSRVSDRYEASGDFDVENAETDYCEDYDDFNLGAGGVGGARGCKSPKDDKKGKGDRIYSSKHTRLREARPKTSTK